MMTTHINKVEIRLVHNSDPNRVARKVREVLEEMCRPKPWYVRLQIAMDRFFDRLFIR